MDVESKYKKHFTKNFIVFFLGSFGTKIISFLLVPFYTSILTTGEYGTIDIFNTTETLLIPIVTLGLLDAVFRFTMGKEYDNESVLSSSLLTCICSYFVLSFILFLVNKSLHWPYMTFLLAIIFIDMIYQTSLNYAKAIQHSVTYVIAGLTQTTLLLVLNIIFLAYLRLGVKGYFSSYLISYFVAALGLFLKERIYKYFSINKIDKHLVLEMLRYSIPLMFSSISWWIITSSDRYMILYFYDDSQVGLYSVATKIPLIIQSVTLILQNVWQISTNEVYEEDKAALAVVCEKFTRYFQAAGFFMGSVILLLTPFIMKILAQKDFYQGWVYAPFLILSVVYPLSTGMLGSLYGAFKQNKGVFVSVVSGAILNVILNFIFLQTIGVIGATISTAICRLYISVFQSKDTEKFLKFNRHYKKMIINNCLLLVQAICLIYVAHFRYLIQCVILLLILLINHKQYRAIINQLRMQLSSIISKRN
jgi:O-antigen/teichoic acid export membrane protein